MSKNKQLSYTPVSLITSRLPFCVSMERQPIRTRAWIIFPSKHISIEPYVVSESDDS